jgi:NitT/TauT family transport system ATP-binding protein
VADQFSLDIEEGTFVALVGPSGCGKSTLLHCAAGLLFPPEGRVLVFGEELRGTNRHATYLFQQDALLPWCTVLENVKLGLTFRGVGRRAETEARQWIRRVGLAGFEDRFPHQLSGGMRKRVAIAQTWIVDPRILLMDEPFGALDVQTRQNMENELLALWQQESRKTVLFVTHDLEEAIALADRVVVLSIGPARIKGDYPIALERPRDVAEIRLDPEFTALYTRIWADLREEVRRSHEFAAG